MIDVLGTGVADSRMTVIEPSRFRTIKVFSIKVFGTGINEDAI